MSDIPRLTPEEARVLGALVEKAMTTPEYYPMTVSGLVAACNQRSNRHPVTDYDQQVVEDALAGLDGKGLVGFEMVVTPRRPSLEDLVRECDPRGRNRRHPLPDHGLKVGREHREASHIRGDEAERPRREGKEHQRLLPDDGERPASPEG